MRHDDGSGDGHRFKRGLFFLGGLAWLVIASQIALRAEPTLYSTLLVGFFIVLGLMFAAPDRAKELVKTLTPLLSLLRSGKAQEDRDELP